MNIDNFNFDNDVLVISPHQDDESLGLAIFLQRIRGKKHIVFLTNGAPSKGYPLQKRKIPIPLCSPEEYAALRKDEATKALSLLGIPETDLFFLNHIDSNLSLELDSSLDDLRGIIRKTNPHYVFSPSYEGSHPDHDACAVLAKALKNEFSNTSFYEYALYNYSEGEQHLNEFSDKKSDYSIIASSDELEMKKKVIDCYVSQAGGFIDRFPRDKENIRIPDFRKTDGRKPVSLTFGEKYFGFKSENVNDAYVYMRFFLEKNNILG